MIKHKLLSLTGCSGTKCDNKFYGQMKEQVLNEIHN